MSYPNFVFCKDISIYHHLDNTNGNVCDYQSKSNLRRKKAYEESSIEGVCKFADAQN